MIDGQRERKACLLHLDPFNFNMYADIGVSVCAYAHIRGRTVRRVSEEGVNFPGT